MSSGEPSSIDPTLVSAPLAAGLGPAAALVLAQWAEMEGYGFKLVRWLANGRSSAQVAVVREAHQTGYRLLILKIDLIRYDRLHLSERRRQLDAFAESPRGFPARHLAETAHQSLPVGDGRWIVFQTLAGHSLESLVTLGVLLEALRRGEGSAETFTSASERVVRSVLRDWAVHPMPKVADMTAASFLQHALTDKLRPETPLTSLAADLAAEKKIDVGRAGPLSNPFALLSGRLADPAGPFTPFLGRAHGDLNVENVLLPDGDPSNYRLIDLAKYTPDAPLSRDPVYLVLYVVGRILPDLSPSQRDVLIDALIGRPDPAERLPAWLADFIRRIRQVAAEWMEQASLTTEWRQQSLLSLVACALIYTTRKSTDLPDRDWFLQLAAHATDAYLGEEYRRGLTGGRADPAL
ncbi:hypothetical protein [Herbidospora sp. RD11066]